LAQGTLLHKELIAAMKQGQQSGLQNDYTELRTAHPEGGQQSIVNDHTKNPIIAAGKAISILTKRERIGHCEIETASAYGAAVAIPQIARSSEWSGTLTALAIRSYFFLAVNIGLQSFVLAMIGTEQLLMYPFAGQMRLCDFGASMASCSADPEAPNCMGPGGTTLSYPRLYSFSIWSTRKFIKDSLKSMFPHRASDINAAADPGEYGVESYWCRTACVFMFRMAVVDVRFGTIRLAYLLFKLPTEAQSWIRYDPPAWGDKDHAKAVHGWTELDLVKFQVAGMPFAWKAINFVVVFVPKMCLWLALASTGVQYLMETANIVDMVVNAMALTFVLDIDEMVFARLTTKITQHIMSNLERLPLYDTNKEDNETAEEVIHRFHEEEYGPKKIFKVAQIIPMKLVTILCLHCFFQWLYYTRNCTMDKHGGLVSKEMHYPKSYSSNLLGLMFGVAPEEQSDAFWTMPEE